MSFWVIRSHNHGISELTHWSDDDAI